MDSIRFVTGNAGPAASGSSPIHPVLVIALSLRVLGKERQCVPLGLVEPLAPFSQLTDRPADHAVVPPALRQRPRGLTRLRISALRRREVRKPAVYDHAMGLFRSAVGLFRGRASKDREEAAAGLLKEQAKTVKAQAEAARPEVKLEARPNPDNPGWGRTVGQEIGKAREDRASQE